MEKIDFLILEKFQNISEFIQEWIGINNFTVAKKCLHLYLLVRSLSYFFRLKTDIGIFTSFIIPIILIAMYLLFKSFLKKGKDSCSNKSNLNILALDLSTIRQIFLALFVISLIFLPSSLNHIASEHSQDGTGIYLFYSTVMLSFGNFFEILFLYFVSCTPKPKKPSRLKKFILKIKTNLSKSPAPAFG